MKKYIKPSSECYIIENQPIMVGSDSQGRMIDVSDSRGAAGGNGTQSYSGTMEADSYRSTLWD